MSTISVTISGVSYPIHIQSGFQDIATYEMRDILTFTVIDSAGTAAFQRGQPVVFSDSVAGTTYTGFVSSDRPQKLSPDPNSTTILHTITCMDTQYLVDKRSNSQNYANWYAGDIVSNMAGSILAAEGVGLAAAMRYENHTSDFNAGNNNGTVGSVSVPSNAGNLILSSAGTDFTYTENTTADFSSGTLTNVTAANNLLTPTSQSALYLTSVCIITQQSAQIYLKIWSGSMTIGSNDTLNYTLWIPSGPPQAVAWVDIICSDGTSLSTVSGLSDQNNVPASPTTDLAAYASNQWYTRQISIPTLSGKTITSVAVGFAGSSAGTYAAYFKNIYLGSQSGSPFFSTTATATQINPPQITQIQGYNGNPTTKIVQTFDPSNSYRVSTSQSISAVSLLGSSLIQWSTDQPKKAGVNLYASFDGGTTYYACTNGGPLPTYPSGSSIGAVSLTLKEQFTLTGTDPVIIPFLESLSVSLYSAPAPTSAKSDVAVTYATAANWNTGTHSNTTTTGNSLTPGTYTRNWNDHLITNQTFFPNGGAATESASSGAYVINNPANTATSYSRFDFASVASDFTIECDMQNGSGSDIGSGVILRSTFWAAGKNAFAYAVLLNTNQSSGPSSTAQLVKGSNVLSGTSTTTLATYTGISFSSGTTYHFKIVVSGSRFRVYINGSGTAAIDVIDSTYLNPGYVGYTIYSGSFSGGSPFSCQIDNFQITPAYSSTWTSAATSISALGTCGQSIIQWTETNTTNQSIGAVIVLSSIDGGSTWQTCANGGGIPNLTPGMSVIGKSVQLQIQMTATSQTTLPSVPNLTWRVCGAYPGSSGTRTTLPLGFDTFTRANQSGFGTASDGLIWAKTGTGTAVISSNTAQISNTTGDVDELLGSATATDQEDTVLVTLSNTTTTAGSKLRYVDTNNYYCCAITSTTCTLIKKSAGTTYILKTVTGAYTTNTPYYVRFRVAGSGPVNLYGKVWLGDGSTAEPGVVNGVLSPITPQWTITASD